MKTMNVINTEYEYDKEGNVTKMHSVSTFDDTPDSQTDAACIECCDNTPGIMGTFLAVAVGALLGAVLSMVVRNDS